jgi:formyltetrahydrofolate synthetase
MLTNKTIDPASDIAIARAAMLRPIEHIAESLGIPGNSLFRYGPYKGKVALDFVASAGASKRGKLILVTAISPTPAGEGKTTTTIGLGDALRRQGHKTALAPASAPRAVRQAAATPRWRRWKKSTCTLPATCTPSPPPITSSPR